MKKSKLSNRLKAGVISKGWWLLSLLPLAWVQALAVPIGSLVWRFAKRERNIAKVNLALCFPKMPKAERDALGKQSIIEITRTMLEMGRMWMAPKDKVLADFVSFQGLEAVEEANRNKQPVILLGPHIGQWELIAQFISHKLPFTFMYSPPKLAELDSTIREGRCRMGGNLVPADLKGVAGLLKALKRGEMIGILPDQVPEKGQGGKLVPFYGQAALTATLLPKLVQKTGAKVFTALAKRLPKGKGFELILIPADEKVYSEDEETAVAGVNASVEQIIAYAPEQYQWAYKRFKNTPGKDVYKS
ncbi:MAG: lysophospholipid acyltransferase family protein [Pseudomonadaceae bacterium]|nr:lysophospholipid acyltransferase family protein [Pseudomonadaceae bacterium]